MKGFSADLISLRDDAIKLRNKLEESVKAELPKYKDVLIDRVYSLDDALSKTQLPEYYKVAVIGRFKVGKSSFVNKLANERLAGVETSPETAAISIFRYAESTYADIELISKEEWEEMREIYDTDKNDPSIKRYSSFITFNERFAKKDGDKNKHNIDLSQLEEQWLKLEGHTHRIDALDWKNKDGKKQFLKEIKHFTSSQSPLHYMVNRLIIYAPIPLLKDHIELIDTPGLDDTERFRVKLTEDIVKEVDAILFLTVSGGSYSQSDKDFIIRQLRQRQIKHLQIIVTKVDVTYEARVKQAKEDDEEPPSFDDFKEQEYIRIQNEIKYTLDELLASNQVKDEDGYYFINQLDNLHIHFVSTDYFDKGDHDKSGIPAVKDKLYEILSNSYRFEQSKKILVDSLNQNLEILKLSFCSRLDALENDYNADKVQMEIEIIRNGLNEQLNTFKDGIAVPIQSLIDEQKALGQHLSVHLDNICLLANTVLHDLETTDIAKNWKRRRYGGWGYLEDLQSKIADKIFPNIEILLNQYISQLDNFSHSINRQIEHLQQEIQHIEQNNKLSGLDSLSLSSCQDRVLKTLKTMTSAYTENQRSSIIKKLDDFVNDDVQDKISDAKGKVSAVSGRGTTTGQNNEVQCFYREVRQLLSNALRIYLERQLNNFSGGLLKQAEAVQPQISAELMSQLDVRIDAIQSNLSDATAEEKKRVAQYLTEMLGYFKQSLSLVSSIA
jgi:tRNA U34 5-carboxymethylaminomethyl modifying GTPase MnmE/TrmE